MIPKILHCVWCGPNPLPADAVALIDKWKEVMPDYEIMVWGNDNVMEFDSEFLRTAFAVKAWNRVANYIRLSALIKHGGIYLDTDMDVLKPFDPLLGDECFFGVQRDDSTQDLVNNAVIGAVPNHPFITELRDALDNEFIGYIDVSCGSGPGLVSVKLADKGLNYIPEGTVEIEGVKVYPKEYFYPYKWDEEFHESCITPQTYAVHLWDHTWSKKKGAIGAFIKNARKYLWLQFTKVFPTLAFKMAYQSICAKRAKAA